MGRADLYSRRSPCRHADTGAVRGVVAGIHQALRGQFLSVIDFPETIRSRGERARHRFRRVSFSAPKRHAHGGSRCNDHRSVHAISRKKLETSCDYDGRRKQYLKGIRPEARLRLLDAAELWRTKPSRPAPK